MKLFEASILARAAMDGITEAPCPSLSVETTRLHDQTSDGHRRYERDRPISGPVDQLNSEPVSCFSCGHYDGAGAFWPGLCRYFETIGQEAKEIDFNVVDVSHGCQCYTARPGPRVVHSVERQRLKGDDPGWIRVDGKVYSDSPKMGRPPHSPKMVNRISPIALEWLREHRQELWDKGWTARGLYRRNLSRGICWSDVWDMPGLSVVIESTGCLCFEFKEATGRKVKQTAWPMKQRSIKKEKIK